MNGKHSLRGRRRRLWLQCVMFEELPSGEVLSCKVWMQRFDGGRVTVPR